MNDKHGMRRIDRWVGWTAVAVVVADWLTKLWIRNRVAFHHTIELVDGWVHLVHRRNEGIAFGLFDGSAAAWKTPVLLAVSAAAIAMLARLAWAAEDRRTRFASALVLGGAVGNLFDRIADGGVTDFVLVRYFPYVFNIADVAITVGGVALALLLARPHETEAEPA